MPVKSAAGQKKKKTSTRRSRVAKSTAAGQFLGYSLQEVLLTHRLMDAPPGSYLSLEVVDDVAEHQAGNTLVAIQSKSALVTNPITDRAVELWKTLRNWLDAITAGDITLESATFILYVSKSCQGILALQFHNATTMDEAARAIGNAKRELWGKAPQFLARDKLPESLAVHANLVLSDPRLPELLVRFRLEFGSGNAIADFDRTLEKQFLADGLVAELSSHALGWVKRKITPLLQDRKPATVPRDEFHAEMSAYLRRIAFKHVLQSYASTPSAEQMTGELPKTYVRQLEFIEVEDSDILSAIADFLNASTNRSEWAQQGLIHELSFADLDTALAAAWRSHRIKAKAQFPSAPLQHGQCLYADCMNHSAKLHGMETPDGFVRGCFHALSDAISIGWHPDHKELLKSGGTQR